jgi:diadenosine tetraphosphate (Ap4A) HIT family hydrolase
MKVPGCPLCGETGGVPIFSGPDFRVVRAAEPGMPAFYRLVWTDHVREFSDLDSQDRHRCIDAVTEIEQALRHHLEPVKVNLATLGNAVPHLHWHIVARFPWDSHFPARPGRPQYAMWRPACRTASKAVARHWKPTSPPAWQPCPEITRQREFRTLGRGPQGPRR